MFKLRLNWSTTNRPGQNVDFCLVLIGFVCEHVFNTCPVIQRTYYSMVLFLSLNTLFCIQTLTRHSWISYTDCWIVYKHWPDTRELVTQTVELCTNIDQTLVNLLNCEIGGLDCHVITTEYRTRVDCVHI